MGWRGALLQHVETSIGPKLHIFYSFHPPSFEPEVKLCFSIAEEEEVGNETR